jgi:hypothetical protein
MRRIIIGVAAVAALLVASAAMYRSSAIGHATGSSWTELVVNTPASEHHLLKQVDVASCRDQAIAGQDRTLAASSSRLERQDLAQKAGVVVEYCRCKFAGTEAFMTKSEMVTQWLSASASLSDSFPHDTRAKLDQVAETCAEQYGLRT